MSHVLRIGFCAVLTFILEGAAAKALPPDDTPTTEWLVVEVWLNGHRLPEFEDVLKAPDGHLWLPLEPLVRAAEGEFSVVNEGVYRVALGASNPKVEIDTIARHFRIDGDLQEWPEGGVQIENRRLLLGETQLSSLFGLSAVLSEDGLKVDVESTRPLPADLRRLRERRYRDIDRPYALLGTPRGNLRFSTQTSPRDTRLRSTASGTVAVEAGYLSNRFFFNGNDRGGLQTLRWTGGRTSPAGEAFGIPGLYRLEGGDVSGFRLPLLGSGGSGRGFRFSTAPLTRPDLFDVIRIEGDALPDWDAELYRGRELIDFQSIGGEGRYDFDDVPLGFGTNVFRVVLYGPQGQVEEREIRRRIPGGGNCCLVNSICVAVSYRPRDR